MTPLSKRLIIALAISAAVNLLCAGLFVGGAIRRHRLRDERSHFGPGPRGPAAGGPRFGRGEAGPLGGRGFHHGEGPFAGLLAGHRDELAARRQAVFAARRSVEEALTNEPFDAAALDRSLGSLRAETATTQEALHKALVDAARAGDAEARRKLARGFQRLGALPE